MAEPVFGRLYRRKGSIIGTEHRRIGINNQDFVAMNLFSANGVPFISGVVCDGCTVASAPRESRNEVGAALLGNYVLAELELLVRGAVPLSEVPTSLYHRSISYLSTIARSSVTGDAWKSWKFIERHLLTTVIGFVASPDTLVVFRAGDGVIVVNDEVEVVDEQGAPRYLAYHLVDRRILQEHAPQLVLPQGFSTAEFPLASISRFAIATDGLANEGTPKQVSPVDLVGIFNHEKEAPAGLQWHLNLRSREGRGFKDDCSAVALVE